MDSVRDIHPKTGTQEQWTEAFTRLEDYLRAHQIPDRIHSTFIALKILQLAARRHEKEPHRHPTSVTLQEAHNYIEQWFKHVFQEGSIPSHKLTAAGRVALLVSDANWHWPSALFADRMPEEMKQAMRNSSVQTGPELELSSMVPRDMQYGPLEDFAAQTWQRFRWRPTLLAFLIWSAIFFITLNAYYYFNPKV